MKDFISRWIITLIYSFKRLGINDACASEWILQAGETAKVCSHLTKFWLRIFTNLDTPPRKPSGTTSSSKEARFDQSIILSIQEQRGRKEPRWKVNKHLGQRKRNRSTSLERKEEDERRKTTFCVCVQCFSLGKKNKKWDLSITLLNWDFCWSFAANPWKERY